MQKIIATQDNAIIIQEDNQFGTIYRLIENGTLFTCVKDTATNQWIPLRETTVEPPLSRVDTIKLLVVPTLEIEVYASGGEMGDGYLDNNLSYFLGGWDAVENLKWHWQTTDWEIFDYNVTEPNWDNVASDIQNTGTVFVADGYHYGIYKTSIRLIDFLMGELE